MTLKEKFKQFFSTHSKGRYLKQNIAQQGFYGADDVSPKIFKPGEFISEELIGKYKIPSHLFIHPDSLRNVGAFKFAAERKDIFNVGIIRTVKGLGDVLILSIIAKALKEEYGTKVNVWFAVHPGHEVLLENNPHIDRVFTSQQELMAARPDIHLNVNDLEFKTELRKNEKVVYNRTALYLDKMGLSIENKTPIYVVTDKEKLAAQKTLKKLKYDPSKSLIGIQLFGSNISKTYPHMAEVSDELEKRGYQIFYLDIQPYKYTLREIAAIVNETTLIITPNSFFYHLAGALKKRAVALFGYTDGKIWTEDYEKVTYVQIPCPENKDRCWWRIECIPGATLQEKEIKGTPKCLSEIPVSLVLKEVDKHLVELKNILILVLTYNCLDLTKQMIDTIRTFHNYDLFVVDNNSTDGTRKWLDDQKIDYVSKKMTVCKACNIGLQKAWRGKYDYMMLCSNDVVLADDYIDTITEVAERRKSYLTVGKVFNLQSIENVHHPEALRQVEKTTIQLSGGGFSATLISRECIREIGKFDECFYPRYQEDEDYLLRVRLSGHDMVETFATSMLHKSGGVVKSHPEEHKNTKKNWDRNVAVFVEKWGINPYTQGSEMHNLNKIKEMRPKWRDEIKISVAGARKRTYCSTGFSSLDVINEKIKKDGLASILITRYMGGFGDILFMTVVAKALRERFKDKIQITYMVPQKFGSVLLDNPFIDETLCSRKIPGAIKGSFDTVLDLTDYEYHIEMDEIIQYGEVVTPRTQIYLEKIGLKGDLKPNYKITKSEKNWAKARWRNVEGGKRKIVVINRGSNMMKIWPHMPKVKKALKKDGFKVFKLQYKDGRGVYTFREAAAIVSQAHLVIGVDTGITNLAATLDVPVIAIYSHWNSKIPAKMYNSMIPMNGRCPYFPSRNYCGLLAPCFPGELEAFRTKENIRIPPCLQNLQAETVLEEAYKVLK